MTYFPSFRLIIHAEEVREKKQFQKKKSQDRGALQDATGERRKRVEGSLRADPYKMCKEWARSPGEEGLFKERDQ